MKTTLHRFQLITLIDLRKYDNKNLAKEISYLASYSKYQNVVYKLTLRSGKLNFTESIQCRYDSINIRMYLILYISIHEQRQLLRVHYFSNANNGLNYICFIILNNVEENKNLLAFSHIQLVL